MLQMRWGQEVGVIAWKQVWSRAPRLVGEDWRHLPGAPLVGGGLREPVYAGHRHCCILRTEADIPWICALSVTTRQDTENFYDHVTPASGVRSPVGWSRVPKRVLHKGWAQKEIHTQSTMERFTNEPTNQNFNVYWRILVLRNGT